MTTIAVLIARRVAGNWRLMSALALGFVIAVGLMSATVIYADALDDLGLDFALDRSSDDDLNIVVRTSGRISRAELDHLAQTTEAEFDSNVARFMRDRIRSLRSGTFFPAPAGTPVDLEDELRPRAFLQSREDILEHVTMEGVAPSGDATLTNIEAAVGRPAAERLGIQVGDQFDLYPFWNEEAPPLVVTVVGIYEQTDPTSDYWTAAEGSFDFLTSRWTTYAFFVDEGALIDDIGSGYANMPGDYTLVGLLDRGSFGATQTADVRGSIASYDSFIGDRVANIRLESELPAVLEDFEARLFFSRIPLFILIIQIVGIALYYLVMVASMLVDRQAGEIALLKSRGGTTTQVMLVYLVEGLALCAVALALGPLLASVAVAQMGRTPIFDDLSGGSPLEAALTPQAYAVAAGGAILALAALLIPAFFATRRTIVHYKQSLGRKDQQPIFFRYYFDLFFVALLGLLFFQLREQGTLATENLFGDLESDPLLLVSPAIFLITAGVLFLRLFPLLLRGISFAFSRTQLTTPLVALWHLVRNPTHYGRLVLLLILATSLGAFAAGFGSTLNTNYGDRGRYEAGADARLAGLRPAGAGRDVYQGALDGQPGIDNVAVIAREDVNHSIDTFNTARIQVIAIDERFQDTAFFRGDFASGGLEEISAQVGAGDFEPPPGPQLAEGHNWVIVDVLLDAGAAAGPLEVHAQLRDSSGQIRDVLLEEADWAARSAEPGRLTLYGLIPGQLGNLYPPLELSALSVRRPFRLGDDRGAATFLRVQSFASNAGRELLRDTDVSPVLPGLALVEEFDNAASWEVIDGQTQFLPLSDQVSAGASDDDPSGVTVAWTEQISQFFQRGIRLASDLQALPVYASSSLLAEAGVEVGDSIQVFDGSSYWDLEIRGEVAYFPTITDPAGTFFVVADLERFIYLSNRTAGRVSGVAANELWLETNNNFDLDYTLSLLPNAPNETSLAADIAAGREQDPLTAAGWQGILAMSFGAILLLSAVGFVVYSYLSAQGRRLEFAILRTLGLTRMQVAGVVAFEQGIVVGVGMIAGSLVGSRLGPLLISYLGITEEGTEVVPPYQDVTDWFTLIATYGTLVAVFAAATLLIIGLYSRLAIHRVLRLGEL